MLKSIFRKNCLGVNYPKHFLRSGQTDLFTMVTRNLGPLEKCMLGAVKRDDKALDDGATHDTQWHCHQVVVTNKRTGDR